MTARAVVETYLRAKDENRPHLMRRAFTEAARLEMAVETGAITFPPLSEGVDAIAKVLVRDFGQAYENVYTFCLTALPPVESGATFRCSWIVGMSEKTGGAVRVGCGYYDWTFEAGEPGLAESLLITIKSMQVMPADRLIPVMQWLSGLPYPWCGRQEALKTMPDLSDLEEIRRFIAA